MLCVWGGCGGVCVFCVCDVVCVWFDVFMCINVNDGRESRTGPPGDLKKKTPVTPIPALFRDGGTRLRGWGGAVGGLGVWRRLSKLRQKNSKLVVFRPA